MTSPLRQLLKLITDGIERIELEAERQNTIFPGLDDAFDSSSPGGKLFSTPALGPDLMLVASAASQLIATVKFPGTFLYDRVMGYHVSSCLRAASEAGIVEVLREAGPAGLHARDIALKVGTEEALTARILRLLATHYIFREVSPNVFANNRISSVIDTGKDSAYIVDLAKKAYMSSKPGKPVSDLRVGKYENASGLSAIVDSQGDECFKASAYLAEAFIANDEVYKGFKRAYDWGGNFFEWNDKHPGYLARLQGSFAAVKHLEPPEAILRGFDWRTLPPGSLVADVGGGNGSLSELIAGYAEQVKVVVEDRSFIIDNVTKPTWQSSPHKQGLVESGRVSFRGQDFFTPQPADLVGKVDVFLLRHVLHDWSHSVCATILKHLHAAAAPHTRLLIVDSIVPYACSLTDDDPGADIPGNASPSVPEPLLPNFGAANATVYFTDITMENILGAQERTIGEFVELARETGWQVVRVHAPVDSEMKQVECVKVSKSVL